MAVPKSGKHGRFQIDGVNIPITKWSSSHELKELDATNSEGGGYDEFDFGTEGLSFTVEANWDASAHPFKNPPDIKAGKTAAVKLFVDKSDVSPTHDIPTAKIFKVDIEMPVPGLVNYTITAKASGAFTNAG